MCIKCVGNTGKNHCSEVFEDKLQFLWKRHSSVGRKYSWAPPKAIKLQNQRSKHFNSANCCNLCILLKPKWQPVEWFRYPCYDIGYHRCINNEITKTFYSARVLFQKKKKKKIQRNLLSSLIVCSAHTSLKHCLVFTLLKL